MKYEQILDSVHDMKVGGINLDSPNLSILTVTEENFEDHLSKQAAGLAYFGTMFRAARDEHDDLQRAYEARWTEMYAHCTNMMNKTEKGRFVIKDVEAMAQGKYADEITKWKEKIDKLREHMNVAEMFYDAWKQKSFVLNNFTAMISAGLLSVKTTIAETDIKPKNIDLVRKHIERRDKERNNRDSGI